MNTFSEQIEEQKQAGDQFVSGIGSSMDWTRAWSGNGMQITVAPSVLEVLGEDAKYVSAIVSCLFGENARNNMHFGVLGGEAPEFAKKHVSQVEAAIKALSSLRSGAKEISVKTKKEWYNTSVVAVMADGKKIHSM